MALFHAAKITPTKAELIAQWAPTRPWGPAAADPIEVIGSYRFDDPDGRVGMETHLVSASGVLMQVPLTYRDEPLDGGWTQERVPVDGFELGFDDATASVLQNDRFELTVFRRPVPGPRPPVGLTATWDGQPNAVVLAQIRERAG